MCTYHLKKFHTCHYLCAKLSNNRSANDCKENTFRCVYRIKIPIHVHFKVNFLYVICVSTTLYYLDQLWISYQCLMENDSAMNRPTSNIMCCFFNTLNIMHVWNIPVMSFNLEIFILESVANWSWETRLLFCRRKLCLTTRGSCIVYLATFWYLNTKVFVKKWKLLGKFTVNSEMLKQCCCMKAK